MALEKATLQAMAPNGQQIGGPITVLFNPAEYTLERSNTFQQTALPGLEAPITQFTSGGAETLSMELFFDTYTDHRGEDVRRYTEQVSNLLKINADLHAPPICRFQWGRVAFKAVLERLNQRFTMFLADGTPVRAVLTVTFREYKTLAEQLPNPPRRSADRTRRWVVKQGDSLWGIAAQVYNDPGQWRPIARANGLLYPRSLAPGVELVIPPLE
ncbi:MAG: LysM peptidoglycan-binding domain-containing protein [Candidatus Tectimicrobiota bacterium]